MVHITSGYSIFYQTLHCSFLTFVGRLSSEECLIEVVEGSGGRGGREGGSVGCSLRGRSIGGGEVDRLADVDRLTDVDRLADGDKLGVGGGAPGAVLALPDRPLLERLSFSLLSCFSLVSLTHA